MSSPSSSPSTTSSSLVFCASLQTPSDLSHLDIVREQVDAWTIDTRGLVLNNLSGHLWGVRGDVINTNKHSVRNIFVYPTTTLTSTSTSTSHETLEAIVYVKNELQQPGEQAGLIWYIDDSNYVKLVIENLKEQCVVFAREETCSPVVIHKSPISPPQQSDNSFIAVRLTWCHDTITASYARDTPVMLQSQESNVDSSTLKWEVMGEARTIIPTTKNTHTETSTPKTHTSTETSTSAGDGSGCLSGCIHIGLLCNGGVDDSARVSIFRHFSVRHVRNSCNRS